MKHRINFRRTVIFSETNMCFLKAIGIVYVTAFITAALGSDFCPSLPAMNCSCPSGWELWQKACYRLTESRDNWAESKSSCLHLGGEMAAPRSLEEMKIMVDVAWKEDGNIFYAWVACSDINVDGTWECDGQEGREPFMKWEPGQPDDSGDCAAITARSNGTMDDGGCSYSNKAFCTRQASCTPRPTQPRRYCFSTDTTGRIPNSICLLEHVIREFNTESVSSCGSACIEEPGCRSFNIKKHEGKKLCQLNSGTSSEDKTEFQITEHFCIYAEVCFA